MEKTSESVGMTTPTKVIVSTPTREQVEQQQQANDTIDIPITQDMIDNYLTVSNLEVSLPRWRKNGHFWPFTYRNYLISIRNTAIDRLIIVQYSIMLAVTLNGSF